MRFTVNEYIKVIREDSYGDEEKPSASTALLAFPFAVGLIFFLKKFYGKKK